MPKGQVILRGKPNKAIQVNCSQGFPFHPFFPCRWSILNRYEHSRNWNLYCTGQLLPWAPGKPAFLTNDCLLSNIEAQETKKSVFSNVHVGIWFEIFIIDPVKRISIRPAYSKIYTDKLYKSLLKIL